MTEIYTRKGIAILVDDEDYDRLNAYTWRLDRNGYAMRSLKIGERYTNQYMAREIAGTCIGDGKEVDHINGVRLDNRKSNLRFCDRKGNTRNTTLRKDSASGRKGVRVREDGRITAYIRHNGKQKHLGTFDTVEDAHEFYCLAADLLFGEFANYG